MKTFAVHPNPILCWTAAALILAPAGRGSVTCMNISTLAGKTSAGSADGTGVSAQFFAPASIVADNAGILYVADTFNHTIRKITLAGDVSTIAGSAGNRGSGDGGGANARFFNPTGIAVDSATNLYVADTLNDTIRKITPVGTNWVVSTVAGSIRTPGNADGVGSAARFVSPSGIAVGSATNLYVADTLNHTIRKITLPDRKVSTIAGSPGKSGAADGAGTNARFFYPSGIAVDNAGNLYVADAGNNTIRKITPTGPSWFVSTIAGFAGAAGFTDDMGSNARFNNPSGIGVDSAGNLYVADAGNNTIRKITPSGTNWDVSTIAGSAESSGSVDGPGSDARFNSPSGIAADRTGHLYVADSGNNTIRKASLISYVNTAVIVSRLAGSGYPGYADGSTNTQFDSPNGGFVDAAGYVYIADTYNHRIRKVSRQGEVSTVAGTGVVGDGDGPATMSQFSYPLGVCVDATGTLLVADSGNNKVRKVVNGEVRTVAGSGVPGYKNGPGTAALLNMPNDLVIDALGNLFVTEFNNHTVRQITRDGMVSTWVGNGNPGDADGPRTSARLNQPGGIALDGDGNLYVAEWGGNRIRKISVSGQVSTVAGNGIAGYADGLSVNAQFNCPDGIVVDARGNIFVADNWNNVIRRISPKGVVETLAGTGKPELADGGGPQAQFSNPSGLGLDSDGSLYVVDGGNHSVRKIEFARPVQITTPPATQTVTQGQPVTFTVLASGTAPLAYQWKRGGNDLGGATESSFTIPHATLADAGSYTVVVRNAFGPPVESQPALLTVDTTVPALPVLSAYGNADLSITLIYTGTLVSSAQVSGPYVTVAGATSPFKVTPTRSNRAIFYRTRQ